MNLPVEAMADPGIVRSLWYDFLGATGVAVFNLGFSGRWFGAHHMPREGPVLVIANHQSFLDPWLVGIAVRRPLVYLARKTLFRNPLFAALIRSVNAVPIDQEGVGKEGLRIVLANLERGRAVLVFPEGERCLDGKMHELRPGIHLLIKKIAAKIVPVGIAGAYDAYPRWRPVPIPAPLFLPPGKGTLSVVVGPALDSAPFAAMPREQALAELFTAIKNVQEQAEQRRRR